MRTARVVLPFAVPPAAAEPGSPVRGGPEEADDRARADAEAAVVAAAEERSQQHALATASAEAQLVAMLRAREARDAFREARAQDAAELDGLAAEDLGEAAVTGLKRAGLGLALGLALFGLLRRATSQPGRNA